MKELLTAIVTKMVYFPDEVKIYEQEGESSSVLEIKAAKKDMGIIMGRGGKNLTAIRILMAAAAAREKKRVVIELVEPEKVDER